MKLDFPASISIVLLVCSCTGEAAEEIRDVEEAWAAVDPQFLISPGKGVGRFQINEMTGTDEDRSWSKEHGLELGEYIPYMEPTMIWWVSVSSPEFSTKEGLRVGSSAGQVLDVLSNARIEVQKDWDGREQEAILGEGIQYYLENDKVERITVGQFE